MARRRLRASAPPKELKAGPVEVRHVEPRPPAPRRRRAIPAAEDKDAVTASAAVDETPPRAPRKAAAKKATAKKATAKKAAPAKTKAAAPVARRIPRSEYLCPVCHHYCDNRRKIVDASALVSQ
jgi:hypothetical protein